MSSDIEISNNVVCATSKGSDQPAHTCSLITAFAHHLNILPVKLFTEQHFEFLSLKGDCKACLSLFMSKCHIVGSVMPRLKWALLQETLIFVYVKNTYTFVESDQSLHYSLIK